MNFARDEGRRQARERDRACEETTANEIGRELEVQERVLTAVSELRDPYRTVIYMRYYRELTPPEIQRELEVPLATVESRLTRGRALLRERLTREHGDRKTWIVALLPLFPKHSVLVPATVAAGSILSVGVLGMKMKIVLSTLFLIALVAVGLRFTRAEETASPLSIVTAREPAELVEPAEVETVALSSSRQVEGGERAQPTKARATSESTAASSPDSSVALSGNVLDLQGRALSVRMRFTPRSGDVRTTTADAAGRFHFADLTDVGRVTVDEPGWTTVIEGALREDRTVHETTVVVAPSSDITVHAVDDEGDGIADALVRVRVPVELRARLQERFEQSAVVRISGKTNSDGRLAVSLPAVPGIFLQAEKDGFEGTTEELSSFVFEESTEREVRLVLRHLAHRENTLAGRVIDEIGSGIPRAVVELGRMGTRADDEGRFHFDLGERDPFMNFAGEALPFLLTAVAPGRLPVTLEASNDAEGRPVWPEDLVIQLAEKPLAISGRVVDLDGEALEGAVVFLPKTHLIGNRTTLEAELRGEDEDLVFFLTERTDAQGRFTFHGLLDEPYDIAAYREGSLLRGELSEVPAGSTDVEIRIDLQDRWPVVRGQVLTRSGDPVAGVRVTPRMWTQSAVGPSGNWNKSEELPAATTDSEGAFVLYDIPRQHLVGVLESPDLMYEPGRDFRSENAVENERGELIDCTFVGVRRLRFQVQLDDPNEADSFRLVDPSDDEPLAFKETATNYNTSSNYLELLEGRSRHLFVAETVEALVLKKDGEDVRRVALTLLPGEEVVVR